MAEQVGIGQRTQETQQSDFNALYFFVKQMLSKIATTALVQVVAVRNAGEIAAVGTVDVTVLHNQMTGDRKAVPHGTIYNIPYLRLQGGANAIVLDPQVGDIGMCGFCMRDISIIKKTKKRANPGSYRTFDWADGLYLGGMLNGIPTQYVQFSTAGIKLHSPTAILLDAPDIKLTAPTIEVTATTSFTVVAGDINLNGLHIDSSGNATAPAAATIQAKSIVGTTSVKAAGKELAGHNHGGVQTGSGNTGTNN